MFEHLETNQLQNNNFSYQFIIFLFFVFSIKSFLKTNKFPNDKSQEINIQYQLKKSYFFTYSHRSI
jgi:hypothetical protein